MHLDFITFLGMRQVPQCYTNESPILLITLRKETGISSGSNAHELDDPVWQNCFLSFICLYLTLSRCVLLQ